MTTTFRARSAADLLSAIPTMAGYTPAHSVVMVPFSGTTSIGLFRLDLPHIDASQYAATCVGMVCKLEEATGLMVIVYASGESGVPEDHPYADLGTAFTRAAAAAGLDLGDCIYVFDNGWFAHGDPEVHPHSDVGDPPLGPVPRGNQSSGTRLPAIEAERKAEFRNAVVAFDQVIAGLADGTDSAESLADIHDIIEHAVQEPRGTVAEDAALLWVISQPALRDVALSQWCHGVAVAQQTLHDQLDWLDGAPYPPGQLFLMGEGPAPEAERLTAALERLRYIAAETTGRDKAAPLACAAWISWALCNSTHAASYATRALKAQPSHGLSQIMMSVVNAGMLPEWAFSAENRRGPLRSRAPQAPRGVQPKRRTKAQRKRTGR